MILRRCDNWQSVSHSILRDARLRRAHLDEVRFTYQLLRKARRARWFETRTGQRKCAARHAPHHEGAGIVSMRRVGHLKNWRGVRRATPNPSFSKISAGL